MRLGLFGGSFDPVHNGHLALAGCCAEQARLDEVWLIPSAVQPFKQQGPVASDADRCAMLRLAIEGRRGLALSTVEIDRGGVSYTVETLRQLRSEKPEAEFFFLMGADTLRELPGWREPEEVLRLATPLVVGRPGEPELDTSVRHLRVTMPPMEVSSSELRRRLAAGAPISGLVPSAVEAYIAEHGLYQ
jgi:nicotinate-nucleotide adenylyltransferase